VSLFFPLSVTLASLCFGASMHAAATSTTPYDGVAATLVATMLGLAILEHWFLVLPLPDAALWRWALKPAATGPSLLDACVTPPAKDPQPRHGEGGSNPAPLPAAPRNLPETTRKSWSPR
jgi:hypothetical protein